MEAVKDVPVKDQRQNCNYHENKLTARWRCGERTEEIGLWWRSWRGGDEVIESDSNWWIARWRRKRVGINSEVKRQTLTVQPVN